MAVEAEVAARMEKNGGQELSESEIDMIRAQLNADIEIKKKHALDAGGLFVLATERHESRRIDNQLRGRTGRQGDPGKSKFYISVEDDLMRIFAADRLDTVMRRLGIKEDEAITHPWMNKAMETSQRKIEQRNFEIRKNVLKYDDVINDQRKVIFEQRRDFMHAPSVTNIIDEMREDLITGLVALYMPERAYAEQWDMDGLDAALKSDLNIELPVHDWAKEEGVADAEIRVRIMDAAEKAYRDKTEKYGEKIMQQVENRYLLEFMDFHWRQHLQQIDQLRSVIHLRGYGQRDPLNEFKEEAFTLFQNLLGDVRSSVTRFLMQVEINQDPAQQQPQRQAPPPPPPPPLAPQQQEVVETHLDPDTGVNEMTPSQKPDLVPPPGPPLHQAEDDWSGTGRNSPCPCGSGKKYKQCHGAIAKV